jgi:hypothetical protein
MQWVFNFAFFEQYSHFFRHIQNKVTMCTPTENKFAKQSQIMKLISLVEI